MLVGRFTASLTTRWKQSYSTLRHRLPAQVRRRYALAVLLPPKSTGVRIPVRQQSSRAHVLAHYREMKGIPRPWRFGPRVCSSSQEGQESGMATGLSGKVNRA